jgi:hypothetical protein
MKIDRSPQSTTIININPLRELYTELIVNSILVVIFIHGLPGVFRQMGIDRITSLDRLSKYFAYLQTFNLFQLILLLGLLFPMIGVFILVPRNLYHIFTNSNTKSLHLNLTSQTLTLQQFKLFRKSQTNTYSNRDIQDIKLFFSSISGNKRTEKFGLSLHFKPQKIKPLILNDGTLTRTEAIDLITQLQEDLKLPTKPSYGRISRETLSSRIIKKTPDRLTYQIQYNRITTFFSISNIALINGLSFLGIKELMSILNLSLMSPIITLVQIPFLLLMPAIILISLVYLNKIKISETWTFDRPTQKIQIKTKKLFHKTTETVPSHSISSTLEPPYIEIKTTIPFSINRYNQTRSEQYEIRLLDRSFYTSTNLQDAQTIAQTLGHYIELT